MNISSINSRFFLKKKNFNAYFSFTQNINAGKLKYLKQYDDYPNVKNVGTKQEENPDVKEQTKIESEIALLRNKILDAELKLKAQLSFFRSEKRKLEELQQKAMNYGTEKKDMMEIIEASLIELEQERERVVQKNQDEITKLVEEIIKLKDKIN